MDLLYPCVCTRAQVAAAASTGRKGPFIPGPVAGARSIARKRHGALDVTRALALTGPLDWEDALAGQQQART